jgi:hypothetical protein
MNTLLRKRARAESPVSRQTGKNYPPVHCTIGITPAGPPLFHAALCKTKATGFVSGALA